MLIKEKSIMVEQVEQTFGQQSPRLTEIAKQQQRLNKRRIEELVLQGRLSRQAADEMIISNQLLSKIVQLPSLQIVDLLSHKQLLQCMRFCPESKYFLYPK